MVTPPLSLIFLGIQPSFSLRMVPSTIGEMFHLVRFHWKLFPNPPICILVLLTLAFCQGPTHLLNLNVWIHTFFFSFSFITFVSCFWGVYLVGFVVLKLQLPFSIERKVAVYTMNLSISRYIVLISISAVPVKTVLSIAIYLSIKNLS